MAFDRLLPIAHAAKTLLDSCRKKTETLSQKNMAANRKKRPLAGKEIPAEEKVHQISEKWN